MLKYFVYLFLLLQDSSFLFCTTVVMEQSQKSKGEHFQTANIKPNEFLEVADWLGPSSSGHMAAAEDKYFEALKEKQFKKASPYFIYIVKRDMSSYYENELQQNTPELLQAILAYQLDVKNYEPLRQLIDSVANYLERLN